MATNASMTLVVENVQFLFLAHTHVDSPPPSALNHKCHILALLLWSEEVMTWPVGVHAEITDHHIFLNEGLKIHQPKCCDKNNIDQETHLKESMYNRKFHNWNASLKAHQPKWCDKNNKFEENCLKNSMYNNYKVRMQRRQTKGYDKDYKSHLRESMYNSNSSCQVYKQTKKNEDRSLNYLWDGSNVEIGEWTNKKITLFQANPKAKSLKGWHVDH